MPTFWSDTTKPMDMKSPNLILSVFFIVTPGLENFAEFGKVYAKNRLETSLIKNKVIKDEDLDIVFNFPNTEIFNTNIAQFLQ